MKSIGALVCGLSAALILLGATSLGAAQARPRARRGPRIIRLEEIVVEGRVQKPNAFYILERSSLGFEVLELRTSFVREVVRSVERQPF